MSREFTEVMNVRIPAGSRTLYLDLKKKKKKKKKKDGSRYFSISEAPHAKPCERFRILLDEQYVTHCDCYACAVVEQKVAVSAERIEKIGAN